LLLLFPGIAYPATIPEYERLQPITTNITSPSAVATDDYGSLYVTESSENRLLIFDQNGTYKNMLAGLQTPIGTAVDSSGRIFVGNTGTHTVDVYDQGLTHLFNLGLNSGEAYIGKALSIAVDTAGKIYVADSTGGFIKVYNPDGTFNTSFGGPDPSVPTPEGKFHEPSAIVIDAVSQEVIVTDMQMIQGQSGTIEGARVQVFDLEGNFKRSFGDHGLEKGEIFKPLGVAVDGEGRVYLSDARTQSLQVFDSQGIYLGALTDNENPLRTPLGLAMSNSSRLYAASLITSTIEVFQITGTLPSITVKKSFFSQPVKDSVYHENPSEAVPVSVGPVASGGEILRVRAGLYKFSHPVDLYGAFNVASNPDIIHVLRPDAHSFFIFTADQIISALSEGLPPHGVVPWKENFTGDVHELLFDIQNIALQPGRYNVYLLAAPAGSLSSYFLWETYFVIP
jgi:sugar lactone lactonase YvrE